MHGISFFVMQSERRKEFALYIKQKKVPTQ